MRAGLRWWVSSVNPSQSIHSMYKRSSTFVRLCAYLSINQQIYAPLSFNPGSCNLGLIVILKQRDCTKTPIWNSVSLHRDLINRVLLIPISNSRKYIGYCFADNFTTVIVCVLHAVVIALIANRVIAVLSKMKNVCLEDNFFKTPWELGYS